MISFARISVTFLSQRFCFAWTPKVSSFHSIIGNEVTMKCKRGLHVSKSFARRYKDDESSTISGMTAYASKKMFLTHPKEHEETVTTQQLLNDCKNEDEILLLIGDMHRTEKLWNDEIVLYFNALLSMRKALVGPNFVKDVQIQNCRILNDENFQKLLGKTLHSSVYLKSPDLAHLLHYFAKFQIPSSSFVIRRMIKTIQCRINDFFPRDVVFCILALNSYKTATTDMQALRNGLLLHLENLATDGDFFIACACGQLSTFFILARFIKTKGSPQLKKCLLLSCVETLRILRNNNRVVTSDDAVNIIFSLYKMQIHDKQLINFVMNTIKSKGELTQQQKSRLSESLHGFHLASEETWTRLLSV